MSTCFNVRLESYYIVQLNNDILKHNLPNQFEIDRILRVYKSDYLAEFDLYEHCYNYFCKHFHVSSSVYEEMKDDIFQDAFLIIWTEIQNRKIYVEGDAIWRVRKNGKAARMTCSLQTFLISIARNRHLNIIRDDTPLMSLDIDSAFFYDLNVEEVADDKDKIHQAVDESMLELSRHCIEILTLYYVKGLKLDEILKTRDSNTSKNGLKTSKSKCLSQLKRNVIRRISYER